MFNLLKSFIKSRLSPKVARSVDVRPETKKQYAPKLVEPIMPRTVNQAGIDLIHSFEALELSAYPDPGSELGKACTAANLRMRSYQKIENWQKKNGSPWTIGWGQTGTLSDGTKIEAGLTITKEVADATFENTITQFCQKVAALVKVDVTDNQFAALTSFAYNVGAGTLSKSSLLSKLNSGDVDGAANAFLLYNKAGGVVLKGLTKRRVAERELFLKDLT